MSAEKQTKPLTDRDLIKWVALMRAQRRLPAIFKRVTAEHKGHMLTPARVERIRGEIEKLLDAGRVPELGEMIPIKVKCEIDGRRLCVQVYVEGEQV